MTERDQKDGVHTLLPRARMVPQARKLRDAYARIPEAPYFQRTFGLWMCLETWQADGLPQDIPLDDLFHFDPPGHLSLGGLGWCTAAFSPPFEERVIRDLGDTEIVQDTAGRHVLYFKGRRQGFMPEYVDHPVKDMASWEQDVAWRLDPELPARWRDLGTRMERAVAAAGRGLMVQQNLIGGYMYLRSLIGPEQLLYAVYDQPDLLHMCMQQWLHLADRVIARHQQHVTLDELYLAEDICYNAGALISPDMMREFLIPYYQQLIANIRLRQLDPRRHLYIQIDTDGHAPAVMPVYMESIDMDVMSPFEVASNCDVVALGTQYPRLMMAGGIDKRILARSPRDIDRMVEEILPPMRERGGYIPTCDHGVPPEVSWKNYLHYRNRCVELGE